MSEAAKKRIRQRIREWHIPRQTSISLNELAKRYNHHLRGWLEYFSHFTKSAMREIWDYFDRDSRRETLGPPQVPQTRGKVATLRKLVTGP